MTAKALRKINPLFGQCYEAGAMIPDEVVAKISPQQLRALIDKNLLQVDGMEAGNGSGVSAHIKARSDQHQDRITKLEAANAALTARLEVLEGKAPAAPTVSTRRARAREATKEK